MAADSQIERYEFNPRTLVIGIDCSSKKLAAYWSRMDGWNSGWRTWEFSDHFMPEESPGMALRAMRRFARTFDEQDAWAFVEQPVVAGVRNLQSTIKQSLVVGPVMASLADEGMRVVPATINSWKKQLGKGGISKDEVRAIIDKRWPGAKRAFKPTNGNQAYDQDLYDSYGLCQYGIGQLTTTAGMG